MCCFPGDNRLSSKRSHEPRGQVVLGLSQPRKPPILARWSWIPVVQLLRGAVDARPDVFVGDFALKHDHVEALRKEQRAQRYLAAVGPRQHVRVTQDLAVGVARWWYRIAALRTPADPAGAADVGADPAAPPALGQCARQRKKSQRYALAFPKSRWSRWTHSGRVRPGWITSVPVRPPGPCRHRSCRGSRR